jgi:hypothetical protein
MKASTVTSKWILIAIILVVLLIGLIIFTFFLSSAANSSFSDPAIAITAIGLISVGIERTIETIWSILGILGLDLWSYRIFLNKEDQSFILNLNQSFQGFMQNAIKALGNDQGTITTAEPYLANIQAIFNNLGAYLDGSGSINTYDPQLKLLANTSLTSLENLAKNFPDLQTIADTTSKAVNATTDFFDTFKDNPIRRLVSIYIGVILGLGVASLTGLDVIKATLNYSIPGAVALTGVLFGLGSNPTHEVIQLLSEIKLGRQAENAANGVGN